MTSNYILNKTMQKTAVKKNGTDLLLRFYKFNLKNFKDYYLWLSASAGRTVNLSVGITCIGCGQLYIN